MAGISKKRESQPKPVEPVKEQVVQKVEQPKEVKPVEKKQEPGKKKDHFFLMK